MSGETNNMGPLIQRRFDWAERLSKFLHELEVEAPEFDWDHFNCASCWADAVEEMTGYDFYADYRAAETAVEVARIAKSKGFNSPQDALAVFPTKPISRAMRGDLLLVPRRSMSGVLFDQKRPDGSDRPEFVDGDLLCRGGPVDESIFCQTICLAEPPYFWALSNVGLIRLAIPYQDDQLVCLGVGD